MPTILTLLAACVGCSSPEPAPTRNVILISLDTLRADALGLYGYPRPTSPFLDELAERSVVFEHAFAQYPSTLTSHMSMLTGLYPAEHGVYPPAGTLSPEVPLLAEILQDAGFTTAGYTEGGYVRGNFGFRRGFDDFDARDRSGGEELVEKTFRRATRFLHRVGEESFFLFVHTYAVHAPYQPPKEIADLFWDGPVPEDAFQPVPRNLVAADREGLEQSPEAVAWYRALYDAEIRHLDGVLRSFFAELDELGLSETTSVIVTSDHGEEFREHGRFNHEQLYQEVTRVPFLIVHPGASGRRSERVVELVDVTPTVLALAGVETEVELSGVSVAGELTARSNYPKRIAYSEANGGRRSLYSLSGGGDRGWWPTASSGEEALLHLLTFPGQEQGVHDRPWELYVTSEDPGEQNDVSQEVPSAVQRLSERLEGLRHEARAAAEQGDLDEELRERLRALGYLQ